MTISRMQEPRQLYGLGGFLKKIGKGVKSFVKSPFGKAALLGLGGFGLAGMGPLKGLAGLMGTVGGGMAPQYTNPSGLLGMFTKAKDAFTNMSTAGKWGVGGITSWLLSQGMSGDEVQATVRDPNKLKPYLSMYYKNINPDASDDEVNEFVETNTTEYAADGGRIGYSRGSGEGIESIDIEEKLQVGAPEITYTGNRMPPEENMQMASHEGNDAWLERRFEELLELGLSPEAAAEQAQKELREGNVPEPFLATGGRVGFKYGTDYQIKYLIDKGLKDQLANMSPKEITQFYDSVRGTWTEKADGGRIGYSEGSDDDGIMSMKMSIEERWEKIKKLLKQMEDVRSGKTTDPKYDPPEEKAMGGRIGLRDGFMERYNEDRPARLAEPHTIKDPELWHKDKEAWFKKYGIPPLKWPNKIEYDDEGKRIIPDYRKLATPVKRAGGGMGMPTGVMRTNEAGVTERDYRDTGGFVPVGIKERADDVPAMLSKNEFVMTADAVRGAGGGDMDKGAQLMYNNMKNLEKRVG